MYGCESWTIKNSEHQRIDAFELWCWRRLLRVLWTARRSNQSILKEISPEYSLKGLMLKLKLQYFGHLIRKTDSLEKILMLGKIEGRKRRGRERMRRRRGRERMRWLDDITDSMDMSLSKLWKLVKTGKSGVLKSMGSQRVGHDWVIELNWTFPAYWTSLDPNKPVWRGINLSITYVYDSVFISNFSIICSLIWGRTPILFFIKSSKHWLTLDS